MIAFYKSLVPGIFLSWLVSLFIGSGGSTGGYLNVHTAMLGGQSFYWSWPLFVFGTGLCWAILWMME